jgi:hypothetical protein
MRNLYKLKKDGHIVILTNIIFEKYRPCGACQARKQVRAHHHVKNIMTTIRPLEMLHIDLFGPITYINIGGNKYGFVIIDDYFCFTWFTCKHFESTFLELKTSLSLSHTSHQSKLPMRDLSHSLE